MIIKDIYSRQEKDDVKRAIKSFKGVTTSVTKIAEKAAMNPNRVRFVIDILIYDGEIEKVPTKQFNKNYVRYSYKVLK